MRGRSVAISLAWWYIAFGLGSDAPQLFGPFLSEEQCQQQAAAWTASGLPSTCLRSEILGVAGGLPAGTAAAFKPRPSHVRPQPPKKPHPPHRPPTQRAADGSA